MNPYFPSKDLRPGDVLLMKGIGQVSDLIAWFGDSTFSHAAIMCSSTHLIEAAAPTSRQVTLADRLKQAQYYDFIDAYRPTDPKGCALSDAHRQAIAESAKTQLNIPYPLNSLLQLGLFAMLRNKIPADEQLRWLLHEIIDHLLKFDPGHMVCSELVYQAMRQADLAPTVLVAAELDLPFPHIDVVALIKEWWQDQHRVTGGADDPPGEQASTISSAALNQNYARLRQARNARSQSYNPSLIPDPNPADVMPVDLETSPQLRRLGRLELG